MKGRAAALILVLIALLALAILLAPLAADAQPTGKVSRIGVLSATVPRGVAHWAAFEQKLRDLGYVDGRNFTLEFRNSEGKLERMSALAADLVRLNVDLIVAAGPEATLRAARQAASTIPIVMVAIDYDPIALGYVASLARPGGNITGVFFRQIELTAKRLELLKEAIPKLHQVAVLSDRFTSDQLKEAQTAARALDLRAQVIEFFDPPYDFAAAFASAAGSPPGAVLVLMSPVFFRERGSIAAVAAKYRLPTMFGEHAFAGVGGLMAYGPNTSEMLRNAAIFVDKILKGAKPADLPVEQPTKFALVINLKTAKALDLTIPPALLLRADQIIE